MKAAAHGRDHLGVGRRATGVSIGESPLHGLDEAMLLQQFVVRAR